MKSAKRILIVDDEDANREILSSFLGNQGYQLELAGDGFEALAKLKLGIDLIYLDLMMPGMDGFEVARRVREDPDSCDIPIIMVTSMASKENRLRSVEAGVNDFISKPIDMIELQVRTKSLLKMKEAQDALKKHKSELEEQVQERTSALRQSLEAMASAQRKTQSAYLDTIRRLALAAEFKDEDTSSHIQRISGYCVLLAETLHLPPGEVETLRHASPMHDVGKIGIPDRILLKPDKLTAPEWEIMMQHAAIGARILGGSSSELLRTGEIIALSHHEKWDGSGYPKGLKREEIPLEGRICAVADVFDALTSRRPYKEAFSNEEALEILKEGSGRHFESRLVDLFVKNFDEVLAIQKKYREG
ncbi:MAG: response regulator [Nitrospinae bacterium]|nr:response regulator [Nitrospinota bacterium]